jgi:hypothetical protein
MAASASCPPASPWRRTPLAASPVGAAATAPIDAGTAGASGLDSYRRSKKPGAIKRVVPSARPPLAKRFFRISRHSSIAKRASHPSIALGPRCCSPCLGPFRALAAHARVSALTMTAAARNPGSSFSANAGSGRSPERQCAPGGWHDRFSGNRRAHIAANP